MPQTGLFYAAIDCASSHTHAHALDWVQPRSSKRTVATSSASAERQLPRLVLDPEVGWERVYVSAAPADGGTMCNNHDIVDTMATAVYVY